MCAGFDTSEMTPPPFLSGAKTAEDSQFSCFFSLFLINLVVHLNYTVTCFSHQTDTLVPGQNVHELLLVVPHRQLDSLPVRKKREFKYRVIVLELPLFIT